MIQLLSTSMPDLLSLPLLLRLALLTLLILIIVVFLFRRPSFPANAPKSVSENYPIIGALSFFTRRWEFHGHAVSHSKTGNFSYYAGPNPVVGLSGDVGREVFFGNSQLGFAEGYAVLFGQNPTVKEDGQDIGSKPEFTQYFSRRLAFLLRREAFSKGLSTIIADTKASLDELVKSPSGITDPFESIYNIVFKLTMRTVGCKDIAEDPKLLHKTLGLFETIEQSSTPAAIILPRFPTLALIKRTIAGGRLYMIFKKIVDDRRKTGKREDDPLQHLIDQNDSINEIIQFVVGALFAGQLNSGINAGAVLVYLAAHPYWMDQARQEVESVAAKYAVVQGAPIVEKLSHVPLEAWEGEFKTMDLILRESIRFQLPGTAFRKNISGHDIKVGSEVIPNGAFVTYHVADVHQNPNIYEDPEKFDPSRYLPDRAEDKKTQFAYVGWGAGRHPCLGMRFARLEQNVIVAFFLAMFDYELCDAHGGPSPGVPRMDLNRHAAGKWNPRIYLKYRVRDGATV